MPVIYLRGSIIWATTNYMFEVVKQGLHPDVKYLHSRKGKRGDVSRTYGLHKKV